MKNGNHVVLAGGSDQATRAAVDWFLANGLTFTGEALYAGGERYEYTMSCRLENPEIGGRPLRDFTITYDSAAELSDAAQSLQEMLLKESGYLIPVKSTGKAETKNDPQIRLETRQMPEGYQVEGTGTGLLITGSDPACVRVGVGALKEMIRSADALSLQAGKLAAGKPEAADTVLYADPKAAVGGDGTAARPFATVDELLDGIEREAEKGPRHVTVRMAGGEYLLAAPMELTGGRFDVCGISVDFVCDDPAGAVIAAWVPVTGFEETTVNGVKAWAADLPVVRGKTLDPHQFFTVSGERLTRPRFPESGYLKVKGVPGTQGFTSVPYNTPTISFFYGKDELPELSRPGDVQIVMYHYWNDERKTIASLDTEKQIITFDSQTGMAMHDSNSPAPYFLDNVFEALDAPGEVYADGQTGKLYYVPRPGESIQGFTLYASDLEKLLIVDGLHGTEDRPALTFTGITFAGSDWKTECRSSYQAASDIGAAVTLNDASYVTFRNCVFTHIGDNTIRLIKGTDHIVFDHCILTDVGGGGIEIAGVNANPVTAEVPHDITVTDCVINGYGRVFANGVGILLRFAYDCTLAHNEICDGYYTAVSVGWSWGYGYHVTKNILVEKNHIHDIGQRLLSDMGGIYTLGLQPGTVLRGNLIHDIRSRSYGGWGIYPDEGSSGILIENNICYNFTEQPFHQHYGANNIVRNNIFAFGDGDIVAVTRREDHNSFTMENNIFLTRGKMIFTKARGEVNYTDRSNLMWDMTKTDGTPVICGKASRLADAVRLGMCADSVIADPCFADPEHGDFTFRDTSAAEKIGFLPFDLSDAGIR